MEIGAINTRPHGAYTLLPRQYRIIASPESVHWKADWKPINFGIPLKVPLVSAFCSDSRHWMGGLLQLHLSHYAHKFDNIISFTISRQITQKYVSLGEMWTSHLCRSAKQYSLWQWTKTRWWHIHFFVCSASPISAILHHFSASIRFLWPFIANFTFILNQFSVFISDTIQFVGILSEKIVLAVVGPQS